MSNQEQPGEEPSPEQQPAEKQGINPDPREQPRSDMAEPQMPPPGYPPQATLKLTTNAGSITLKNG